MSTQTVQTRTMKTIYRRWWMVRLIDKNDTYYPRWKCLVEIASAIKSLNRQQLSEELDQVKKSVLGHMPVLSDGKFELTVEAVEPTTKGNITVIDCE